MMATSARGSSLFDFSQQVRAGKAGQLQIGDDDIGRRRFDRRERRLGGFRFRADEIQALADGHAKPADALLVIHDQKAKSRFVLHGFPMVFSTAARSSLDAEGFFDARRSVLREQSDAFPRWPCRR